jgi:hypothetical protein
MQPGVNNRFQKEHKILIAILLLALVNGLIYVIILPPWQHYDEPNHFEYLWLWAERGAKPQQGDYDSEMRRDVARSMIEHDFFPAGAALPDLTSEKPWIGSYSQFSEPPLYYLLGSIPLRILPSDNVDFQLYAARLVSLILFISTILAGYGLVTEITPPHHPLRFLVPLTMALLPGFVDLMTAVNNDVGAVAVFSFFLWGCIRLVRRGPSWQTLLWVVITSALCLITKRSVYIALPILGVALLFAILRGKYRILVWGLMILAAFVGFVAVFSWGDAALWYRDTAQNYPTRSLESSTPVGKAAFRLTIDSEDPNLKLVQIIPPESASQLSGKTVTLGAWLWASQPLEVNSAQLRVYDGSQSFGGRVRITENPQFFAVSFKPQGNTQRAWVVLDPGVKHEDTNPIEIYFDGIILAEGTYPTDQAPLFDKNGSSGTWGNLPFENLLRNPSAESSWLYLRPWADKLLSILFSDFPGQERFSLVVYTLLDLSSVGWFYQNAVERLMRTFWAKFAWGHVSLIGAKPYRVLFLISLFSLMGIGIAFWQRRKRLTELPWDIFFLLGITFVPVWGLALVRGSGYIFSGWGAFVVARYIYPVIIPSVLILASGWLVWLNLLEKWLHLSGYYKYIIYIGGFLVLDVLSLISIWSYYQV